MLEESKIFPESPQTQTTGSITIIQLILIWNDHAVIMYLVMFMYMFNLIHMLLHVSKVKLRGTSKAKV